MLDVFYFSASQSIKEKELNCFMLRKLGFSETDRIVIINADDFGAAHCTNQAIEQMFYSNAITSTSIMMPAPASSEAAQRYKRSKLMNVGIHITLTCHKKQNYRPIYKEENLKSLTNSQGYFYDNASDFEKNADPEEVRAEVEAQIQTAISVGIEPTHLDSHAGSILGLYHGLDFLEVIFDLCEKYALPYCLPVRILEHPGFSYEQKQLFKQRIDSAKRRGIGLIDDMAGLAYHLAIGEGYNEAKSELLNQIDKLKPGITQIVTHPSLVSDELIHLTEHYEKREIEYHLFNDPNVKARLKSNNIKLTSWKVIRDLQRG